MNNPSKVRIKTSDFLFEIGTEELPGKSLYDYITNLAFNIEKGLQTAELAYETVLTYADPRRLAVIIKNLAAKQNDRVVEKRGPALGAAFDEDGNPTSACLGFANSCGVAVSDLVKYKTSSGAWVLCKKAQIGEDVYKLMPAIIADAIKELPVTKPMRWGNKNIYFIRPVHWLVMLYDKDIVKGNVLGLDSDRITYGHRFHYPDKISIPDVSQYLSLLREKGKVIADFEERKEIILQQLAEFAKKLGTVVIDDDLLNETAGLTEWPVALAGNFDAKFLEMPVEALKAVMKNRQRCFYLVNKKGDLLPYFIAISNIQSKDPTVVIKGYERVMRARLSDLKFFYEIDLKQNLEYYVERLKDVVYSEKLGSLYDKVIRLEKLSIVIAEKIGADVKSAKRAAHLAKADLTTEMVKELPDLQGIIGYYYALKQNEPEDVALAIKEHYLPRFSGDTLPGSDLGCVIAIADRIDHIFGAFISNQMATSEKDPFGLRRAALAIIRVVIEKQLSLDLKDLLELSGKTFKDTFKKNLINQILDFIFERLRAWYLEQGIAANVLNAVFSRATASLLDCKLRIEAIQYFQALPQSVTLIAAHKRVNNILKKAGITTKLEFDNSLLIESAEKDLAAELLEAEKIVQPLLNEGFYTEALKILAELKNSIDNFFDKVMVMVEDEKLKNNRLALLIKLRDLLSYVADISLL